MKSGDPKIANKATAWTDKNAPWKLAVQRYKITPTQMAPANKPAADVSSAMIAKEQTYHADVRGLAGDPVTNYIRG